METHGKGKDMELEFKEPSEKPTEAYHKYRSFLRELEKHPDR